MVNSHTRICLWTLIIIIIILLYGIYIDIHTVHTCVCWERVTCFTFLCSDCDVCAHVTIFQNTNPDINKYHIYIIYKDSNSIVFVSATAYARLETEMELQNHIQVSWHTHTLGNVCVCVYVCASPCQGERTSTVIGTET